MSVRQVSEWHVGCDMPGCNAVAEGPCVVCGKDVCVGHRFEGRRGGTIMLVCEEDSLHSVLEVSRVATPDRMEAVWRAFGDRREMSARRRREKSE